MPQVEKIARENEHVTCVFVNCAGPGGAAGFGTQHKIEKSMHFSQENIPPEFGLQYIPHKVSAGEEGSGVVATGVAAARG